MCKSARTVIILWSDHVHNTDITQEREPASSSPQLLFRSEFMRKPQMRVDLPGNCCQRLSVHSSLLSSCAPAHGYLAKQKVLCTAVERHSLIPPVAGSGQPGRQSPIFEFGSPRHFAWPAGCPAWRPVPHSPHP